MSTYIHSHTYNLLIDRISHLETAILILSVATTMAIRIIMIIINNTSTKDKWDSRKEITLMVRKRKWSCHLQGHVKFIPEIYLRRNSSAKIRVAKILVLKGPVLHRRGRHSVYILHCTAACCIVFRACNALRVECVCVFFYSVSSFYLPWKCHWMSLIKNLRPGKAFGRG